MTLDWELSSDDDEDTEIAGGYEVRDEVCIVDCPSVYNPEMPMFYRGAKGIVMGPGMPLENPFDGTTSPTITVLFELNEKEQRAMLKKHGRATKIITARLGADKICHARDFKKKLGDGKFDRYSMAKVVHKTALHRSNAKQLASKGCPLFNDGTKLVVLNDCTCRTIPFPHLSVHSSNFGQDMDEDYMKPRMNFGLAGLTKFGMATRLDMETICVPTEMVEPYASTKPKLVQCGLCGSIKHRTKMKSCARCKTVSYCGRSCQEKHWHIQHKGECKKEILEKK